MKFVKPKFPRGEYKLPSEAAKWTVHQVQVWCRERLGGAPPSNPIEVGSDEEIKWNEVKLYAGRKIKLRTNFKGIISDDSFQMEHTLPMTHSGTRGSGGHVGLDNIGDVLAVGKNIEVLEKFWNMIQELVDWYNQVDMKNHPNPSGMMWKAGEEMHEIMSRTNTDFTEELMLVTPDNMRYSVAAWGVGHAKNGYGETQLEQCLKLYHWLPDADESHPILKHRTTPIMKLIMAESNDPSRRMNLFNAYDSGPLSGLDDKQLDWALGLSEGSFPHPDRWDELRELGDTIADGGSLSNDQTSILTSILSEAFSSTGDVG